MAKTIEIIIILVVFIKSLFISQLLDVCMSRPHNNNLNSFTQPKNADNATGFSVDIFHRDSPQSPYYDPSLSPTQSIINAIRRSLDRSQGLNESLSAAGSTEVDVERSLHRGNYLMRYKIGENKVPSLGAMDTGSDLIWTQGWPCRECIPQSEPHYHPDSSSTYMVVLCKDNECTRSRHTYCIRNSKHCLYDESYGDGTSTHGWLSKDTFILSSEGGTTTLLPGIVFGNAYRAKGNFKGYESGLIGLGHGPDSLVSQLGRLAKGKFSYCLVSQFEMLKRTTRLNFGDNAEVWGEGVVHTPLVIKPHLTTSYYVTLLGFNIKGRRRFLFSPNDGNIMVDSGAVLTKLPDDIYSSLRSEVQLALNTLETIQDPNGVMDLCFATRRSRLWLPTLTFHFRDVDVTFATENMFMKPTTNSLCLLALPAGRRTPALGYLAQANFMVGFDTQKKQVSFKPTDCTKLAHAN